MEILDNYSAWILFSSSFVSATILPGSSEVILSAMVISGKNPLYLVIAATLGNYLGACVNYLMGYLFSLNLISKIPGINPVTKAKAEAFFSRYGYFSLLFSWVPVIGDPLCIIGGLLKLNFLKYSIPVFLGKFARYALIGFLL